MSSHQYHTMTELETSNEDNETTKSLYDIPITILQPKTLDAISSRLNPCKLILTKKRVSRDWQGLAALINISSELFPSLQSSSDPTQAVLKKWVERDQTHTIQKLLEYLEELDRFDIIDDVQDHIDDDIRFHQLQTSFDIEGEILTVEDIERRSQGLDLITYNAFILSVDQDVSFVRMITQEMQSLGLNICSKLQLVPNTVLNLAVLKLIFKRCDKVVLVFSPAFLESVIYHEFIKASAIDHEGTRVVPCVFKPCDVLPKDFKFVFMLDYTRCGLLWDFWFKLRDSILAAHEVDEFDNRIVELK